MAFKNTAKALRNIERARKLEKTNKDVRFDKTVQRLERKTGITIYQPENRQELNKNQKKQYEAYRKDILKYYEKAKDLNWFEKQRLKTIYNKHGIKATVTKDESKIRSNFRTRREVERYRKVAKSMQQSKDEFKALGFNVKGKLPSLQDFKNMSRGKAFETLQTYEKMDKLLHKDGKNEKRALKVERFLMQSDLDYKKFKYGEKLKVSELHEFRKYKDMMNKNKPLLEEMGFYEKTGDRFTDFQRKITKMTEKSFAKHDEFTRQEHLKLMKVFENMDFNELKTTFKLQDEDEIRYKNLLKEYQLESLDELRDIIYANRKAEIEKKRQETIERKEKEKESAMTPEELEKEKKEQDDKLAKAIDEMLDLDNDDDSINETIKDDKLDDVDETDEQDEKETKEKESDNETKKRISDEELLDDLGIEYIDSDDDYDDGYGSGETIKDTEQWDSNDKIETSTAGLDNFILGLERNVVDKFGVLEKFKLWGQYRFNKFDQTYFDFFDWLYETGKMDAIIPNISERDASWYDSDGYGELGTIRVIHDIFYDLDDAFREYKNI